MRTQLQRLVLACSLIAALAGAGRAALPVQDATDVDLAAIWNDPVFKRQFIAGYGFNAEVEPRVTQDEVKILEAIRPLMADNLPKAEQTLRNKMKPDCSAVLDFTLGGILFQQEKMVAAIESFEKAVVKYPSFRRAWRNLGLIYARDGKYDDAIRAFTRMIVLGGGDGYSYGLLGFAYAAKQDYQPAEAAYRNALLLQPENTEWRLGLTRCVFKEQKFQDAATLLDELITRYPERADFWLLQAYTYSSMKQPLKAAQNLEAVDQLGKSTLDSLNMLGDIYVSEGNLMALAAGAYQRMVDLDPKQPLARPLRCAELLAARGALPQARQVANHVRATCETEMVESDRRTLLKVEARLSMADGGGNAETAALLEEIVKLDPLDGEAQMLLGQHYSRLNEPDRAMLYYERAESLESDTDHGKKIAVNARIYHAQVLVGLNRYTEAIPLLRQAQELKPRDDIARYIEQVERIAKSRR